MPNATHNAPAPNRSPDPSSRGSQGEPKLRPHVVGRGHPSHRSTTASKKARTPIPAMSSGLRLRGRDRTGFSAVLSIPFGSAALHHQVLRTWGLQTLRQLDHFVRRNRLTIDVKEYPVLDPRQSPYPTTLDQQGRLSAQGNHLKRWTKPSDPTDLVDPSADSPHTEPPFPEVLPPWCRRAATPQGSRCPHRGMTRVRRRR